jgi:hypothetical protein
MVVINSTMKYILLFAFLFGVAQANLGTFKDGKFIYPKTNKPYTGNLDVINNNWGKGAVEFNKDFIIAAVKANNLAFDFLDSKFKSDKDVVFAAANSKNITKVKIPSSYQEHFKKDRHNN